MPISSADLIADINQFVTDMDLAHQIVQGDASTVVATEGGPVNSFAKEIASLPFTATANYPSLAAAIAATVPTGQTAVRTGGFAAAGDGGHALYYAATIVPGTIGTWQDAAGRGFKIAETQIDVAMLGINAGNSATTNTTLFQAALNAFPTLYNHASFQINTVYLNGGNRIINTGHIIGTVTTLTKYFYDTGSVAVNSTLTVGQTVIPGDFSGWVSYAAASGWAAFQYTPGNLGLASVNQFGIDYARLVPGTASSSGVTIDRPLRYGFNFNGTLGTTVYQVPAMAENAGTLPGRGVTSVIPIDNADGKFQVGDYGRLENQGDGVTAGDTPWGYFGIPAGPPNQGTSYFEYNKIVATTTTSVTFEQPIDYTYNKYWLIKSYVADDIRIEGGQIDSLVFQNCANVFVSGVQANLISYAHCYNYGSYGNRGVAKLGQTAWPRVLGFSASKNGYVSSPASAGAYGTTDNGGIKYNHVQHLTMVGITSIGTFCSSSTQSISAMIGDFSFLPYSGWTIGVTIEGGTLGVPRGVGVPTSAFFVGHWGLQTTGLDMAGGLRLDRCVNAKVDGNAAGGVSVTKTDGISLTGVFPYVRFDDTTKRISSNNMRLVGPGLSGYLLWFRNANDATISNCSFDGTAADTSVRVENSGVTGDIRLKGCRDINATASVVSFGTNGNVTHEGCDWNGSVASIGNGQLIYKGNVRLTNNAYNRDLLQLANRSFWIDTTGHLRIAATSTPVSDTDGNVIPYVLVGGGNPNGLITPHLVGEIFSDTTNGVSYIANGVTNTSWIRLIGVDGGVFQAQTADSTATGGNARGSRAVDWQTSRSAATSVASGLGAVIPGGTNNAASGSNSMGGGQNSTAAGLAALAFGNQAFAGGVSSVALGGTSTDRSINGCHVYAGNRFSVNGDAQILDCVHMFSTAGSAAVRLTTDGAAASTSNTLVLPNRGSYVVSVSLQVIDTVANTVQVFTLADSLVYRGANAAATVVGAGNPVFVAGPTAGTPVVITTLPTLTADTTNGSVNISVTPPVANTNVQHIVARVRVTEGV
jgi:hypothetical protein